jgi:uncharacterized membrane protein HdeD (DUF308 family)
MEELRGKAIWAIVLGGLLIVCGLLAIGHPVFATLTTTLFFGVLLTISGVVEAVSALGARRCRAFFSHLLIGLLTFFVGVVLIDQPEPSAVIYTLLLAIFFVAAGLYRLVTALTQQFTGWGWSAVNGAVTFLLGVLIWRLWRQWPDSALIVIGTFVGIELIFSGWTWVMLGMAVRAIPAEPKTP